MAQLGDQMHPLSDSFEYPLHELLGFDKELRSIRDLLKGEDCEKGSDGRTHREGKAQTLAN